MYTILYNCDLPIPSNIDGRVLKKIFEEDSDPGKREIETSTKQSEKQKLDKALSKLKGDKNI